MLELLTPETSLASLAAAAFLAATLVPLSSEAALFAVLRMHPELAWPAIAAATAGNTAGGLTSYLIGRFLATKRPLERVATVRRWGAPALVLAWLPLVGDALCVAAGWLKVNWLAATAFSAAGRFARYWLIAEGALW
ncbi:MAG: DedA family protein [Burkholderiales bacterium]|nr:DedA family protein [Burkholderiales bacterium]